MVVDEDYSKAAVRLRDDTLDGGVEVYSPSFMLLGRAGALRKHHLRSLIPRDVAMKALRLFAASGIQLHEVGAELAVISLRVSSYTRWRSTTQRATLAHALGAPMYTAGEKLIANEHVREPGAVHYVND